MKAATLFKQCKLVRSRKAPIANIRSETVAHTLKRRPGHTDYPVAEPDAPRVTVVRDDAPVADTAQRPGYLVTVPRVLLIDMDFDTADALTTLLVPEAILVHAANVAEARRLLETQLFSMVIIDPILQDGNMVIHAVHHTPLLIYSAREPVRHDLLPFLNKPYTTPRELWSTISRMLGLGGLLASED